MATKNLTITLMVDKSRNQVAFVESGKDFVDILLSFLTLPMATIARLTDNQSIGGIENLYKSIAALDTEGLLTTATKSMLLNPSNAAADICKNLRVNVDRTSRQSFYICDRDCCCKLVSTLPNTRCVCGKTMGRAVSLMSSSDMPCKDEDLFVKGMVRFLITDDGVIAPVSTEWVFSLLQKLEIRDKECLEKRVVDVNSSNVLFLLKQFFCSEMPFTVVFLTGQNDQHSPLKLEHKITDTTSKLKSDNISVKLLVNRKEKKVIYAEAKDDFVDLLLSFLTFPVGSVVKVLCGSTNVRCIDNLYKSAECLSSLDCLKDTQTKEILLNPKLPEKFCLQNRLIPIDDNSPAQKFYMCRNCDSLKVSRIPNVKCKCNAITNKRLGIADPKHFTNGGFLKSAVYIVTDDMVVTQFSTLSVISDHLTRTAEGATEVVAVDIGKLEALALLQASVISSTVLTDVFASKLGFD